MNLNEQKIKDIISKIHIFLNNQKKVYIKTIPSMSYPRGKFYNGFIQDTSDRYLKLLDDKEGLVDIYYSEISNPSDVQESRRVTEYI